MVFERNDYIGGRLKHIVLDGVTVEGAAVIDQCTHRQCPFVLGTTATDGVASPSCVPVGGDAWSIVNPYMVQLAAELNVQFDNNSYTGNGKDHCTHAILFMWAHWRHPLCSFRAR